MKAGTITSIINMGTNMDLLGSDNRLSPTWRGGLIDPPDSNWGESQATADILVLRRSNQALESINFAGEVACYAALLLLTLSSLSFLVSTNFENAVFSDGTSLTCVIDGRTGNIYNPHTTQRKLN
jgi:hypothetical protein